MAQDAYDYYGDTLTSVAGANIFEQIEAAVGRTGIVVKEITMISNNSFTFSVEGDAWVNSVYQDTDTRFKVSLTNVQLSGVTIIENAIDIFIAVLF